MASAEAGAGVNTGPEAGRNIRNLAGTTARQLRPVPVGPDITPSPQRLRPRRGPSVGTRIAEVALAAATIAGGGAVADKALTGEFPWQQLPGGGITTPGETPKPIDSANPTFVVPSGSPSPEASGTPIPSETPAPSPEVSPSVNPTGSPKATESPTPTPKETFTNIETVPLLPGGKAETDFRILSVFNGTVVAVDRNPDGTVKDFAITIAGKKISRTCPDISNNVCKYKGTTFWINVTSTTVLASPDHMQVIGKGPAAVSEFIVVGKKIPWMIVPILAWNSYSDYNVDVPGNKASLKKLNNSVGESLPRANRSFVFSGIGIALE